MKTRILPLFLAALLAALFANHSQAQVAWDGGGQADGSWSNADNWDNNTLPVFDGSDSLTITRHAAYISAGGTGYTTPVTVAITGDGTGATATATQSSGVINGITITDGGSGYTTLPSVAITGGPGTGAVAQISLTSTGSVATAGVTAFTLGADRSIGRITFGGGGTAYSLSGNTLRLNSTGTSAGTGTALWNANTADGITATVNSNLLLQSGTAGSYTGHFRENVNSSGGTRFNGTITQGVDENWTLRFSRPLSRGQFFLNNAANSIFAIRNDGADVYSEVIGAFGGAALTLSGGITGTRLTDHYTTAVSNSITVSTTSTWVSQAQTRLTGTLSQGSQTLSYGNGNSPAGSALTRLEYGEVTGTGTTNLQGGGFALSSMSQLASGTLNLGNANNGTGVMILSGDSGNNVPTWSDFSSARTFNQSGGANNWRINVNAGLSDNVFSAGGFAARGADLVIPASGGGLSSATFTRNFVLGSPATLDGTRYANHAVKIETAIDYGSLGTAANRYFGAAWNVGAGKTTTELTITGPVHELAGAITGSNVIIHPIGFQDQAALASSTSQFGIIRISNTSNSFTGASRWILGGQRGGFTTMGGAAIPAPGNMADKSSVALVFTSDAAFGDAAEVQVSALASSGSRNTGTLLFEDVNGSGSTTFNRAVNLMTSTGDVGGAAIGSYGGDVVYTGSLTFGSGALTNANSFMLHAQPGSTSTLNASATFTNNSLGATTFNKTGGGTMTIDALTVNGTQTSNSWNVRAGTLLVNTTLAGNMTVSSGATLGGTGTVGGTVTTGTGGSAAISPGTSIGLLTLGGALSAANGGVFKMDLGSNATPGTTHDQIAAGGVFTGSLAAAGIKFEFTAQPGISAGVPYTLLTFASSTGLGYTDLAATVLPAGYILDTAFGTGGWLINSGSLQVQFASTGGLSAYDDWADDFPGFTPTDADLDFDNDGLDNLLEFVLGGDPRISQAGIAPTYTASGDDLVITFKRSDASELQPVAVKIQISDDLVTWPAANDIPIGAASNAGPIGATGASYTVDETGALDTIVVTIPKGAATKKFARVLAIE